MTCKVVALPGKIAAQPGSSTPALIKLPEIQSVDDGPGKPENIELHIGRRPSMAFLTFTREIDDAT